MHRRRLEIIQEAAQDSWVLSMTLGWDKDAEGTGPALVSPYLKPCVWLRGGRMRVLVDEVHLGGDGDDAALVTEIEEFADGLAAVGAVVEGAVVDVHADEAVGQPGVEVAGKLHGVFQGLLTVVEGVLDAVADGLGDDLERFCAQGAADRVAPQGQDQAGGLAPPDAEVEDLVEAAGAVGELALMDDEAGIVGSGQNRGDDLVEGHGLGLDGRIEDFQGQIGGGEGAGDGDLDFAQVLEVERATGDDHGAVALTNAAAAAHQGVVLLQVGVGVEADGGDVEEGLLLGAAVEGLDVAEGVREPVARDADLVGGQAIEHEGVIGVGTMGDGDVELGGKAFYCGTLWVHWEKVLSTKIQQCWLDAVRAFLEFTGRRKDLRRAAFS